MKKKDLLRRLREGKKRKPEPIKVKLDFDVDQDGAPDHYKTGNKHTNKQNNKTPGFFSYNFNDEKIHRVGIIICQLVLILRLKKVNYLVLVILIGVEMITYLR